MCVPILGNENQRPSRVKIKMAVTCSWDLKFQALEMCLPCDTLLYVKIFLFFTLASLKLHFLMFLTFMIKSTIYSAIYIQSFWKKYQKLMIFLTILIISIIMFGTWTMKQPYFKLNRFRNPNRLNLKTFWIVLHTAYERNK